MSLRSRALVIPRFAARVVSLTSLLTISAVPLTVHAATSEELEARLQVLAQQVETLKAQVASLQQQRASAGPQEATGAAPVDGAAPAQPPEQASAAPAALTDQNPMLFGYGELSYSNPRGNDADATADLGRFVLGVGYRFDDKTRFLS